MAFIPKKQLEQQEIDLEEVDRHDPDQVEAYTKLFAGNMCELFENSEFSSVAEAAEILFPGMADAVEDDGLDPDGKNVLQLLKVSGIPQEDAGKQMMYYRDNTLHLFQNHVAFTQCHEGSHMTDGYVFYRLKLQLESAKVLFTAAAAKGSELTGKAELTADQQKTISKALESVSLIQETLAEQRDFEDHFKRFLRVTGREMEKGDDDKLPPEAVRLREILGFDGNTRLK